LEEGLFDLEVREKQRERFNLKSKTGARGGSKSRKGVRTAYDFLKPKEKKLLNGEVESYNMYTTILNWNEWQTKDKETQKNLLTKWREIYPNTKIMEELAIGREKNFNTQSFADLVNGLGVPPKRKAITSGERKPRKAYTRKKENTELPKVSLLEFAEVEPKEEVKQEIQQVVQAQLITKGLHLEYNGQYDVEALNRLFTKLQLLIDGEPSKYRINLSLSEITED
jgi:hypothetical protein